MLVKISLKRVVMILVFVVDIILLLQEIVSLLVHVSLVVVLFVVIRWVAITVLLGVLGLLWLG